LFWNVLNSSPVWGVCYESQAKDKDIALIWISELAGEMKTNISPEKAAVIQQLATIS
jgi:hypothetical protein